MINKEKIDIIIVSYNTADYIIKAINSIYKETQLVDYNIIIVDNASSDESVSLIKSRYPNICLIESDENLGFACGVNLGVQYSKAEYILLLNPDTLIIEHAIDNLYLFSKAKPDNGIWGGVTFNQDMTLNTHNAWSRLNFSTLFFSALGLSKLFSKSCFFNRANYGCWHRDSEYEVDIVCGCFFLTTKELWHKLEGFDQRFFMYAEEADYCLRAIDQGYQPIVTPMARIVHHGGVSEKNLAAKMIKLLKGKVELIKSHSEPVYQPVYKFLLFLYVFNKFLFYKVVAIFNKGKRNLSAQWSHVFFNSASWLRGYR